MAEKIYKILSSSSFFFLLIPILLVSFLFSPFLIQEKMPLPAENLLGLAHPFRDVVWDRFSAGVPVKNPLIADPFLQTYVWKKEAFDQIKNGQMPLWNIYTFSGTPLLANFQSSVFNPLNIFLFLPFWLGWSILIFSQQILASIFMFIYLRNMKLSSSASIFGSIIWIFSGVFISWLEWGTYLTSYLWLPLILLSIDKIFTKSKYWFFVLVFSLAAPVFGGHIQMAFYSWLVSFCYLVFRHFQKNNAKISLFIFSAFILAVLITSVQTIPTFEFLSLSNRDVDQPFLRPDWFLPYKHLISFVAPDFFGNPTRLNYWGVFNYIEFNGYFGIISLIFAVFAFLSFKKKAEIRFFSIMFVLSFLLAVSNPISRLPFVLHLPFISSAQPSRLLSLIVFSLAVLSAWGFEKFIREKLTKSMIGIIAIFGLVFLILWFASVSLPHLFEPTVDVANPSIVAQRNLILPSLIFLYFVFLSFSKKLIPPKVLIIAVLLVVSLDLVRLAKSFEPFSKREWLYPDTQLTKMISENIGLGRIIETDRRIFPPNISMQYGVQTMDGYDPLYLKNYATAISAWQQKSGEPNVGSFNRMVRFENIESPMADLYSVRYILSFKKLENPKLKEIGQEGTTRLYYNSNALEKVYITRNSTDTVSDEESLKNLIRSNSEEFKVTTTTGLGKSLNGVLEEGEKIKIKSYRPGHVALGLTTKSEALVVLTDNYYPGWSVYINGEKKELIKTNYAQMGVLAPGGENTIDFKFEPKSARIGQIISLISLLSLVPTLLIIWRKKLK